MTDTFDIETALSILYTADEDNEFPIEFAKAYVWCGYSSKQKGLESLISGGYNVEGEDYITQKVEHLVPLAFGGSRSQTVHNYYLSIDCFKDFCLKTRTAKGREVRKYFIQAEKRMRALEKQLSGLFEVCMEVSAMTNNLAPSALVSCYAETLGVQQQQVNKVLLKMGWNGQMARYQFLLFKGYGDKLKRTMQARLS